MSPIRILLVDDHPVVREGLRLVLSQRSDLAIVGEASNAAGALGLFHRLRPDVTLMDLHLPDAEGFVAIGRMRALDPHARICVLSAFDSRADIEGAIRAGARGYLVKASPAEEIVNAVRRLHSGLRAIDRRLLCRSRSDACKLALTPRELQILHLVSHGTKNRHIGDALGISTSTVKFHLQRLMEKLGASDRTEAATIALRDGIIRN